MAYGFNDDKSKVEVYDKSEFVLIEENISMNEKQKLGFKTLTSQQLKTNYGIENINDYIVIGMMQKASIDNTWTTFGLNDVSSDVPYVRMDVSEFQVVVGANFIPAHTETIRVLLLKVK